MSEENKTKLKETNPGAGPDPLEGKSIEELKEIISGLEKRHSDDTRMINNFTLLTQSTVMKLKETGLDLQVIGRNLERMLQEVTNPNPEKPT